MSAKPGAGIILIASAALLSCSFIYLGDIGISIYPGVPDGILAEDELITLSFCEPVNEQSFESLFTLIGVTGNEEGDFIWTDAAGESAQVMEFAPHKKLQPGFRYRIKINGELRTADEKKFLMKINVPFYYVTDELPPVLDSVSLSDAEISDVNTPLVLSFSKPMDQPSFDEGFSLKPATERKITWNEAGDQATVRPAQKWINLQYYSWKISADVTDLKGIPLPDENEGSFLVQFDTVPPELVSICPAADNGDGSFTLKSLLSADDLLLHEHLALSFSEEIELRSLKANITFDPSIDGYLTTISPDIILYYIHEEIPPGTTYKMVINEGFRDQHGNATTADITEIFTPSVPALKITSIIIEDENGVFLITRQH